MRIIAYLLILSCLLASCGDGSKLERVEVTDDYGYTEKYTRLPDTYAKDGPYTKLGPNGLVFETANFVNDTLDGPRVIYYESGDTNIIEQYQMGKFQGLYRTYYEEGGLLQEGQYEDNVMVGDWVKYYSSGQLMERVAIKDNLENGPFVEYYGNGNKKAEGAYLEGDDEHGELKLYNENGELIEILMCDRGRCEATWKADSGLPPPIDED